MGGRTEVTQTGGGGVAGLERPRPKITRSEREQIETRNRALVEQELLDSKLVFASRPYEAQIQYSNFCNMSCVMCHDGANPPLRKMSPEILRKVGEQIAPSVSVVIPYDGSEPLIVSWDETRTMAEEYSFDLSLTTNVQFLDEEKFYELKDITRELLMSIDTHNAELFEKIRPGSKPEDVFKNLPRAAELCREHRLECWANIVFMTHNATMLPETVAYLADAGVPTMNVLQMIDVNGRSGHLDPLIHFSAEYVDWIKQRCIDVAKEKHVRFVWGVAGFERHDFRKDKVAAKPSRDWAARWEQRMRRYVPGYCKTVWNRVHVNSAGECTPCSYATGGDLVLGQLSQQDFDEIWNGPTAQDLRRAHATWDYPALCSTCYFTDKPPPETYLPFVEDVLERLGRERRLVDPSVATSGPEHMLRTTDAPTIEIEAPEAEIESYQLALALGGEGEEIELCQVQPSAEGATLRFELPADVWEGLRTNAGYWWAIFALEANSGRVLRSSQIRCMVRHEPIARIEGSTLRYPGQVLPVADLGGAKMAGWEDRAVLPERPEVDNPRLQEARTRHQARKRADADDAAAKQVEIDRQRELVERVRMIATSALPPDATVLVASRGDDALLELDCRAAWHFPTGADGGYIGHDPPDGDWAIEQLELGRARGADHLLIPASASSLLSDHPSFAAHVSKTYPLIAEDEACSIYALGRFPALYGREREEVVRSHQREVSKLVREATPVPTPELFESGQE